MAKAEEVSERTRWNDPADRIVSAYVSLAEGNICVMACESYVTQERIARLPLLLLLLLLSLSLPLPSCPTCPFHGVSSPSLSLLESLGPSSVRGTEVTARPLPPAEQAANRRKNIFFSYPRAGSFSLGGEIAPTGQRFSGSRQERTPSWFSSWLRNALPRGIPAQENAVSLFPFVASLAAARNGQVDWDSAWLITSSSPRVWLESNSRRRMSRSSHRQACALTVRPLSRSFTIERSQCVAQADLLAGARP